jgi:glycosyltransferase involved in cell wall biosynthesis
MAATQSVFWAGGMRIAVIVPCRDRIDSLHNCISSIERSIELVKGNPELSEPVRVLIVNDRSHPGFAATLALLHSAISVIDVDGVGPGAARNTGLKHADADLYMLTDSDCVVAADWCQQGLAWHRNRASTMAQGIPWLFQRMQNPELGACEERLYQHMFSTYLSGQAASMIDTRCMVLAREHFDSYPREVFAERDSEATAESRILLGGLLAKGLRIDWLPELKVYHEDPATLEAVWLQKYRHGSGRFHIWQDPPSAEFLLNRYFLSPILADNDPDYVVPAHLAFLCGYRDARVRNGVDRRAAAWWQEFSGALLRRVEQAPRWRERVESAVSSPPHKIS